MNPISNTVFYPRTKSVLKVAEHSHAPAVSESQGDGLDVVSEFSRETVLLPKLYSAEYFETQTRVACLCVSRDGPGMHVHNAK